MKASSPNKILIPNLEENPVLVKIFDLHKRNNDEELGTAKKDKKEFP